MNYARGRMRCRRCDSWWFVAQERCVVPFLCYSCLEEMSGKNVGDWIAAFWREGLR